MVWRFVALGKVLDLRVMLSDTAQNYAMLAFAAVLLVNAIAKFDLPFACRHQGRLGCRPPGL